MIYRLMLGVFADHNIWVNVYTLFLQFFINYKRFFTFDTQRIINNPTTFGTFVGLFIILSVVFLITNKKLDEIDTCFKISMIEEYQKIKLANTKL